jgi:hypothetical protein
MTPLAHAINSTMNGHLLVFWAMALNATMYFQRGGALALLGILAGAVALSAAHIGSGIASEGRDGLPGYYVVAAGGTALAWVLFILAASL